MSIQFSKCQGMTVISSSCRELEKKHQIGFHFAARLALNHNTKERRVSWKTENEGVNLEFALSAAVTHIHTH